MKKILTLVLLFAALLAGSASALELEGEIATVSPYPTPEEAPYPDCHYAFSLTVYGQKEGESVPSEIVVVAPLFRDRTSIPANIFRRGERVRLKLVPFEDAPDEERQIQTADAINSLEAPYFFMLSGSRVELYDPVWSANYTPADGYLPPVEPEFPFFERSQEAESLRAAAMSQDLEYLRNLLAANGGDWDKWNETIAPLRDKLRKSSHSGWFGDTYFKLGGWAFGGKWEDTASFRQSVLAMNDYLRARNIDLIVLRIPGRAEICADLFFPELEGSVTNPMHYQLQEYFLENDVEYIDLTRRMVAERSEFVQPYWYIEPGEGHAAQGCRVIARELADRIQRYGIERDLPANAEIVHIPGMYKYPAGHPTFSPDDPIPVESIRINDKPLSIAEDGRSQVLLIGDSYFTHPSMRGGATIQHYFAWESGIVPDLLCRMSAGDGLPRFLSRKGDAYLAPRRVVVWVTKPDTIFHNIIPFEPPTYYRERVLLESISGEALKSLDFKSFDDRPLTSFFADEDGGVFKLVPLNGSLEKDSSGAAGRLTLDVREHAGSYEYILVVMRFAWNWTARIEAVSGDWSDTSLISLSDYSRRADYLIPLTPDAENIIFNFKSVKVLRGLTLTLRKLELYGVNK